jgi:hypothetical protein
MRFSAYRTKAYRAKGGEWVFLCIRHLPAGTSSSISAISAAPDQVP